MPDEADLYVCRRCASHVIVPCMSNQGSDDDQVEQRMDALVLRLLKTPPQSHRAGRSRPTREGEAYSDSREARQRRNARRCCLAVLGFVRLSIEKPLAFRAGQ